MAAVFLLGIVLFLLISVGLFIFLSGGSGGFNGINMFNNNQYQWDQKQNRYMGNHPLGMIQSGFLPVSEENQDEVYEIYKQESLNEEERRYFLNNMAIGLIVIFAFALFFLIIGSFLYYNYSSFNIEVSSRKSTLFLLLVFVPFLVLLAGLLYSIRAQKLNFQFPGVMGMDRLFNQFGLENTIANLIKDEESKNKIKMAKIIEQFNWILEINNRKQSAISVAKGLFLISIITSLPLLIMAVSDYFSIAF